MPLKKRVYVHGLEEEREIREVLHQMVLSDSYNTLPTYTVKTAVYPDGLIPFVDKHMRYLDANPKLDVQMYLANLRLMTRIRL